MLGIILDTGGVQKPTANGPFLCPSDPQYNQRGQRGWYYDTPLGAVPTNAEIAYNRGYYPVLDGLGAATDPVVTAMTPAGPTIPSGAEDVIAAINAHNQKVFALSVISTVAVAFSAVLTAYRTSRLLREDARRKNR
jgi:hypothetical protein